jgi:hypothetical protein
MTATVKGPWGDALCHSATRLEEAGDQGPLHVVDGGWMVRVLDSTVLSLLPEGQEGCAPGETTHDKAARVLSTMSPPFSLLPLDAF